MPDLRKILFGAGNKTYVDVTRLRAPSKTKAPIVLNQKSGLKLKKKTLRFRLKTIKAEKAKLLKVLSRPAKFSSKPAKPLKIVVKPVRNLKIVQPKEKAEPLAGEVTHFFDKIQVCVVHVQRTLKVGDVLHFKGRTTDFTQKLVSMQIDHKPVDVATKGQEIGLKVKKEVRAGDKVFIG